MAYIGYELAKAHETGELCGWAERRTPGIAKAEFDLLNAAGAFPKFQIRGMTASTAGRKAFIHNIVRQVLGKDTDNYPQEIGDCVSFGAKNGGEYLTCTQILGKAAALFGSDIDAAKTYIAQARIKFRPIFAPYYYGIGRNYVGQNQIRPTRNNPYGDGSLGSWMADAVKRFGTVFSDEPGVTKYSGSVARAWGDSNATPDLDKWRDFGAQHLIQSTAQINSWDDLAAAVVNGYPCPTASNIGYDMEAGRDGFHRQSASWGHQMCFIGTDETDPNEPYALILNNWGDVHGHLKDFKTGEDLPVGVLRVRRKDAEKHIRAGETYAYSQFQGFPEQKLDKALFQLI